MMNFNYITPQEAANLGLSGGNKNVSHYQRLLDKNKGKICSNCDNPTWAVVDNDMCFVCTTGEADPSDDYELI